MIIDDGNGNIINTRDGCINHIEVFNKIRNELKDILKQPVGFVLPSIRGLIDYISDVLGE